MAGMNDEPLSLAHVMTELKRIGERMDRVQQPQQHVPQISQRKQRSNGCSRGLITEGSNDDMKNNQPTKEHPRRRREPEPPPDDDRTCWNIKSAVPTFAGRIDPDAYLEWERRVEQVFEYHRYSESKKVALATSKFTDHALSWWSKEVADRRRHNYRVLDKWEELKCLLRQRYVPSYYHRELQKQYQELNQGTKTVKEYFEEFESIRNKLGLQDSKEHIMTRFLEGLQERIACKLEGFIYHDLPDLLHYAMQAEQRVKRKMSTTGRTRANGNSLGSQLKHKSKSTEVELPSRGNTLETPKELPDSKAFTREKDIICANDQSKGLHAREYPGQCVMILKENEAHEPEVEQVKEEVKPE